jgi:putative ABC transport system permease protein
MTSLRHATLLAYWYLRSAPGRTLVLVLCTAVALFLPVFTALAAERVESALMSRATASPVLLGHQGNEFDLTMNALYFRGKVRDTIPFGTAAAVEEAGYGDAVPLYVSHTAGGAPVVGTSLRYLDHRGLAVADGRLPAVLGEVVAGAKVARDFNLSAGDTVRSDLTNLYNIAGAYPILLRVTGVLTPNGTPDDTAFFADVKTTWVLDGTLHGHDNVTRDQALNPNAGEGENLEATAAIFMFQEITEANRGSFHLHGSTAELPVSGVLVFPPDARAHDQLLGDYALHDELQAVRPVQVVHTILGIILRVREGLTLYFGAIAASTAAFFVLVLSLSLRLRQNELVLMQRIGSSRPMVALMVGVEVFLVVLAAVAVAAVTTFISLYLLDAALAGAIGAG